MKKRAALIGLVSMLWLGGCIAMSPYETPKGFMDGSIITTSVKARLAGNVGLEGLSINVSTLEGTVLLSGFVRTEEQKKTAGEIATATEGVTKVVNNIVVQ
jgi:osmotically-inducible protein OsmY